MILAQTSLMVKVVGVLSFLTKLIILWRRLQNDIKEAKQPVAHFPGLFFG